jgi:hypothetical protein
VTRELVRLGQPNAETALQTALVSGLVAFQDAQLVDPAVTLIANQRPASLSNGVTPTASTGNGLDADVGALLAALFAARPGAARPALVILRRPED